MKLTRKQVSLAPTAQGFLFLGILGAMLAGSINYNNNAGFILVFLLGGMALISIFHSFKNLVGLEIDPLAAQPVFAGEKALFPIRVKALENQGLSLKFALEPHDMILVSMNRETTLSLAMPALERGLLEPPALTLSSVYPFGLFCLKVTPYPFLTPCLVYPSPLAGPLNTGPGGHSLDGQETTPIQGVDDFQGLKPYQPGHSMGRIAWKALSRGRGVFIKDFTAEESPWVMLDYHRIPGKEMEVKLSRLCAMVLLADQKQMEYGLRLPPAFIQEPSSGPAHKHQCLKALARFAPGDGAP